MNAASCSAGGKRVDLGDFASMKVPLGDFLPMVDIAQPFDVDSHFAAAGEGD